MAVQAGLTAKPAMPWKSTGMVWSSASLPSPSSSTFSVLLERLRPIDLPATTRSVLHAPAAHFVRDAALYIWQLLLKPLNCLRQNASVTLQMDPKSTQPGLAWLRKVMLDDSQAFVLCYGSDCWDQQVSKRSLLACCWWWLCPCCMHR